MKSLQTLGVASIRAYVRSSHFFSESVHYFFLKLYSLLGLLGARKLFLALFLIIFTVLAILAKIGHLAGCVPQSLWKSLKNLKVGVFETDFKKVPFIFRKTTFLKAGDQ